MVAGQEVAVEGLLALEARVLPDGGDALIRGPKLPGGIVQPQAVHVLVEAAAQSGGEDSGDVVFIEMQLPGKTVQGKGLLEMLGHIGDEPVAHIGAVRAVPGEQDRVRFSQAALTERESSL